MNYFISDNSKQEATCFGSGEPSSGVQIRNK